MKKNTIIATAGILALVVALLCGAITVAAADDAVTVQFLSMENGIADLNICVSAGDKLVDYAQLAIKTDAAGVALVPEATTDTEGNPRIEARGNDDGTMTVLVERADTSFAGIAGGDVLVPIQLSGTTNHQKLNIQVTYILCYTDGSTAEGTVTAPVTITGNITSRLEAETDAILVRYTATTEGGVSGYSVGGVQRGTDANLQSYEELAAGAWLKKSEHPMMSFIVDVEADGTYTLDITYNGSMTTGSISDYFMVLSVDDSNYTKTSYVGTHPANSNYHVAQASLNLTAGRHLIRLITVVADTRSDTLKVNWLNVDGVDVSGPGAVVAVEPHQTHLLSGEASYINNFSKSTEFDTKGYPYWVSSLGGYQGDTATANAGITSENFTFDKLSYLGYFAYTVRVPADGYYDMQTYLQTNTNTFGTGNVLLIIDDQKHIVPVVAGYATYPYNAQNLSCYLTEGYHTIIVSGIMEYTASSKNWCNMGALTVSGGITVEGVAQVDPQTAITKIGNTLLLENMVQNKYQFSVTGITPNAENSGLLVWRGEKLAAANGVYEFGTQSYVVNNLSAVDGTIKALGIAAKEQGDDIVARGFVMDANGKYYYSEVIDFKATTYASAVFADNADTSLVLARPTVAAMLNYFGKAQKLFDHTGNGYMDEIQIPTGIDLTYDASYRIALEATPEHFTSDTYTETIYHSLELEDNVYIKYIVPKGSKTSAPTLLFWEQDEAITLDNATQMPMGVNGSYYTASITGIAPKDMGKTFFVSIYDATTGKYSQLDAYSIHQYAGNMITKYAEDSSQAELVDLCKALLTYSHMTKNYFASLNADVVYVSNAGTAYNSGATAADATDWETALYKVKNGGTLYMDNYVMAADETWPAHTKSVTLQGGLDASAQSTLNINGPTTFGAVTLTVADGADVFANGHKVVIGESATVSGVPMLFGATQANSTLTSTNLTVLSGTYTRIYGGGVRGTVGTINLTVGGNAVTDWVYGGGAKASGDWCDFTTVNVTIEGNAKLNEGVYGGNKYGPGIADCTINVTINGGTMEAVLGGHEWSDTGKSATWGGENINLNGDINIYLNGGTITRRVIGGSYNECSALGNWNSSRHVLGNITLYISDNVTMNCSGDDYGIIAGSRYGEAFADETTKIVFTNQTAYNKYFSKLGLKSVIGILTSAADSCDNYSSLSDGNLQ